MSKSYAELLRVADNNSRSIAQQLEEERRKREKTNQKSEKSRPVNDTAIQMILERRRREQEQQKQAEERRLKKAIELRKQQKPIIQSKKEQQKPIPPKPSTPTPVKTSTDIKKPTPNFSYDDLLRYASLNANKQPIPKELAHVAESLRGNKSSTSSNTSKKSLPTPKPLNTTANLKKPVSSSSTKTTTTTTTVIRNNSIKQPSSNNKSKLNTSVPSSNNVQQPIRSSLPSTNRVMNGQRPTSQHQMFHVQRLPTNRTTNGQRPTQLNQTTNGQRPTQPNRMMNGQRPSIVSSRKRPVIDTDDEDDEEMRDFIVDDDDEINNGFDYRKELQNTLKTNFRFDTERYRGRFLDDDDDDLVNMESSFDQIEKEEDYSRRLGLQEDINEILREQAEKKKRPTQITKRPKTAA